MSLIGAASGFKPNIDIDRAELRANAMQICAVVPTVLTALHRIRQGEDPVEPHPDLGYAANYLYMMTGEEPEPKRARAIEQYLISTVDHGFNASTFTGRVVASTGADLAAAVTGAIGALSGPLHGGAPSRALDAARRDRHARQRRRLGASAHRSGREDHGLRPSPCTAPTTPAR